MKKIILTVGCPGAGKSTWANQFVKENSNFYILSRDDFRESLFGLEYRDEYKFSKARENAVTQAQFASAGALISMQSSRGIIIADTNINNTTVQKWEKFAENNDCQIVFKHFHISWHELNKRNKQRGRKAVPVNILRDMYKRYENPAMAKTSRGLPKAIIFDLDGTLAKMNGRSPHDLEKCGTDLPNWNVVNLAKTFKIQGYKIITVSGRETGTENDPNRYYRWTRQWLETNGVENDEHFQRAFGDYRKDDIVKEEIYWKSIADKYDVELCIDDRDSVVEMWRRIGIECWQVNFGDF